VIRLALTILVALAVAPSAFACTAHPSQAQLEGEVMCPVCGTTLDQSESPAAQQIKAVIAQRIAAGDSDCRIKDRLVAEYGDSILAAPPRRGFGLLAWWLPVGGIAIAAVAIGVAAWRWSRGRDPGPAVDPSLNGHGRLDPELERRVDEELARFDG
jgi:cytochrome c-type biogenesis protein CcmH